MDLESWNQIAEILASIAVLVSLIFLIIQLRQSLAQSKEQSQEDLVLCSIEAVHWNLQTPGVRAW
jgi:hypothetical protein